MVKYYYDLILKYDIVDTPKEAKKLAKMTALFVKQAKRMGLTLDELFKSLKEQENGEFGYGGNWWQDV